jgi:hypothetical protein
MPSVTIFIMEFAEPSVVRRTYGGNATFRISAVTERGQSDTVVLTPGILCSPGDIG